MWMTQSTPLSPATGHANRGGSGGAGGGVGAGGGAGVGVEGDGESPPHMTLKSAVESSTPIPRTLTDACIRPLTRPWARSPESGARAGRTLANRMSASRPEGCENELFVRDRLSQPPGYETYPAISQCKPLNGRALRSAQNPNFRLYFRRANQPSPHLNGPLPEGTSDN